MSKLAVFLVFSSWPSPYAVHLQELEYLRSHYSLHLTVIDNGAGLRNGFLTQFAAQKRMILPLRLYPAQVLQLCLEKLPSVESVLWWQAEAHWCLKDLAGWLERLVDWTAIQPHFGLSSEMPRRDALVASEKKHQIVPSSFAFFPPCLLFLAEHQVTLRQWCEPQGQMPLMLIGEDPDSFCEGSWSWFPLATEPVLTWQEAQIRLNLAESARPVRRKSLLESLLRAFPGSSRLARELFPLLSLAEALLLLEETQLSHLVAYPDFLAWTCQALFASGHTSASIQTKDCLDTLYPNLRLPATGWISESLPTALQGPYPAKLTVFIFAHSSDSERPEMISLLEHLNAEIVILNGEDPDILAELPDKIEDSQSGWILFLRSEENFSAKDLKLLQKWLWYPPAGAISGCVQILEEDAVGQIRSICQEARLYPQSYCPDILSVYPFLLKRSVELATTAALMTLHLPASEGEKGSVLHSALELSQKQAWKQALPIFDAYFKQNKDIFHSAQIQLSWMHCLLENQDLARFEKALAQCPQAFQEIPDFWYLKGAYLRRSQNWQAAALALEKCLTLSPEDLRVLQWYSPASLNLWPLLELMQLYWQQLFLAELDIRARQQQVRALRQVLQQLLHYFPTGQIAVLEWSIYIYLALVALLGAYYQPGINARDQFLQNLPLAIDKTQMGIYYIETALLYIDGQFSALPDRLPPGQSYESMRDLQQDPAYLMPFTQRLWQESELDGPEMALAFLVCSALTYRDIGYLLWLVRLQYTSGQSKQAHFSLKMAALMFPGHALLPAKPEQFLRGL
jgi:tetratricopeptide (TPR) repeat protein